MSIYTEAVEKKFEIKRFTIEVSFNDDESRYMVIKDKKEMEIVSRFLLNLKAQRNKENANDCISDLNRAISKLIIEKQKIEGLFQ